MNSENYAAQNTVGQQAPLAEIPSRIAAVHSAIDLIDDQISRVFCRIDTILMGDAPTALAGAPTKQLSSIGTKVGSDIQSSVTRLNEISDRLSNMLGRIAL